MCCGVGPRRSSDPALLWLWCWPAAKAPIGALPREPQYATRPPQKKKQEKKKKKQLRNKKQKTSVHEKEPRGQHHDSGYCLWETGS